MNEVLYDQKLLFVFIKLPLFLPDLKEIWVLCTHFRKNKLQMSDVMQIRPVEA